MSLLRCAGAPFDYVRPSVCRFSSQCTKQAFLPSFAFLQKTSAVETIILDLVFPSRNPTIPLAFLPSAPFFGGFRSRVAPLRGSELTFCLIPPPFLSFLHQQSPARRHSMGRGGSTSRSPNASILITIRPCQFLADRLSVVCWHVVSVPDTFVLPPAAATASRSTGRPPSSVSPSASTSRSRRPSATRSSLGRTPQPPATTISGTLTSSSRLVSSGSPSIHFL